MPFLIYPTLWGFVCGSIVNPKSLTRAFKTTYSLLSLSIMTLHIFLLMVHWVLKMEFLWLCSCYIKMSNNFCKIHTIWSTLSPFWTSSSLVSNSWLFASSKPSSLSPISSIKLTFLLYGHSLDLWPRFWHLRILDVKVLLEGCFCYVGGLAKVIFLGSYLLGWFHY